MRLRLIACNVFLREACLAVAEAPHTVDLEFLDIALHVVSARLREALQERIDAAERSPRAYDAVLLLYGVCGNATVGLEARGTRLVLPRAHDCATLLLGSREAFRRHFAEAPSTPFGSTGFVERGDYYLRPGVEEGGIVPGGGDEYAALVARYGEDNARYLWETLHPAQEQDPSHGRALFIDVPETAHLGHAERFRQAVASDGRTCEVLPGNMRLVRGLVAGDWDRAEYLVVEPGKKVAGVYDWDEIVRAR